ncbi:MAG: gliding motility-associated C-terminal domain-containing protein [Bacteroidota bacterium]|nr:gliding motility-associated C-terminal domain-containing protein [Bacteroidota bacterium]
MRIIHIVFLSLLISNSLLANFRLTENKGQWQDKVIFKADLNSAKLFISNAEITYLFYASHQIHDMQHDQKFDEKLDVHVVKVKFLGANPNAEYLGQGIYQDYSNYFLGRQTKQWVGGVKSYNKLYIKNIYPSIDFELFENAGNLKYNFIVHPGGRVEDIQLQYNGADSLGLVNNQLEFQTRFGKIIEMKPYVKEVSKKIEQEVASAYQLNGNVLSFNISDKRSKKNLLIIDPILVFSTYSGSRADNFGYTATFDSMGNAYAGGTVFDFGFPTTTGSFQVDFQGGNEELRSIGYVARDCGITKYSSDGKTLLYSTYLGGSTANDQPHSMIVDSKHQLMVMGSTKSTDFPLGNGTPYQNNHRGLSDVFIVKFSEDGTQLLSGTFVGGSSFDGLNGDRPSGTVTPLLYNYADDFRGEILLDELDNVYVATSTNSIDFPMVNAFDNTYGGKQDGCVFKLNADLSSLLFSSFVGGNEHDAVYGIDLGLNNDLFITGGSNTLNFGYNLNGLSANNFGGKSDGFIIALNRNSGAFAKMTFVGTNTYDQSYFVKTDKYGKPFIFGQTEGAMGVSNSAYRNANGKMFIKKFNADLSAIELETTFGGPNKTLPDLSPTAFLVDECERIFISGWGGNEIGGFRGGNTNGMPFSLDAYQKTTDGNDFYLAVFSKNLNELQYATFIGGRGSLANPANEHVDGGTSRFDKKGIVYHSVCAGCGGQSLFPTTPDVWSRTNRSDNCNNAIFKFDFENLNRKPIVKDSIYEILATDSLAFELEASDLDLADSLHVVLEGEPFENPNFPLPRPFIVETNKMPTGNSILTKIRFLSGCQHIGLDTILLKVKVYDKGCPTQDSNFATIKIVVKAPPLSITPDVFCLSFRDGNSLDLSWNAFEINRYFKHVILYRENPNGSIRTIDTITSNTNGIIRDNLPNDPRLNNYRYFMIAYNVCNQQFQGTINISTTKEFNIPIDSTYNNYVTVQDNKNLLLSWFKSREEDFGYYDIYRSETNNELTSNFRKIATLRNIDDTSYLDEDVKVSERIYCYKTVVNDKCGHYSNPSNEACNIVLKGDAGHLNFDLDWTAYRDWAGGVRNYELFRRVDTGVMRLRTDNNLLRTFIDDELDLWWGAYFYSVRAYEGNFKNSGFNASSLSNEIRLIQPPQVYVPNAFSPNGDGFNDVWGVSHAFVKEFEIKVFNRWGEKVWQNDFKGNQWDGITRNRLAMNDVFVWIVTYKGWDGKFYTQKGTVTVMP